jgi:protein involved in polysaccharide export with SLBB domain
LPLLAQTLIQTRIARALWLAGAALLIAAPSLDAQAPARQPVSRAELEAAAARAETAARGARDAKTREQQTRIANRLRTRLREGDFQPGHRILLAVYADSSLTDTFTVRADRQLLLPNLPPISVAGLLDSELESFLQKELAKYLRNPTVRAQGLLRLSILGAVGSPGFYSFPMDFLVTDAIMEAGGPGTDAKMNRSEIRRGGTVVVNKDAMQEAFRLGLTLNDIGARPGDELIVPGEKTSSKWQSVATIIGVVTGLAWSVSLLVR